MKKVISFVLCLAVMLAAMVLPAFAEEARSGGTLVVAINGDPLSFNPCLTSDDNLYRPAQNLYSQAGFVQADHSGCRRVLGSQR